MSEAIMKSEVIQGEIVLEKEEKKPAVLLYENLPILNQLQANAQFAKNPEQAQKEIRVIVGEAEVHFQKLDRVIANHRCRLMALRDYLKLQGKGRWTAWERENLGAYSLSHIRRLLDEGYEDKREQQARRTAAAQKANTTRKGQRPSLQPAQETVVEEVVIPSINPLDALLSAYLQTLGDEDGEPAPSKLRGFFSKLDPEWTKNSS